MPWWIGAGDPVEGIELAASHGFDFLEISLDAPWPEDISGPALRDAAQDAGIALGFHAPWRTQALAHPRGVLARAARTVAQECIDVALGAGAEYTVFHVDARDFQRFPRRAVVEQGLAQARKSLDALARSAEDRCTIVVENTSTPMGTPDEIASFLEPLTDVGFCYDPGHASLTLDQGVEGASEDPVTWFDALGRRLVLVHIMDVVRTEQGIVDHLVPGAGEADLAGLIKATRDTGCERLLIEAFYTDLDRAPASNEDLEDARKRVEALL